MYGLSAYGQETFLPLPLVSQHKAGSVVSPTEICLKRYVRTGTFWQSKSGILSYIRFVSETVLYV